MRRQLIQSQGTQKANETENTSWWFAKVAKCGRLCEIETNVNLKE